MLKPLWYAQACVRNRYRRQHGRCACLRCLADAMKRENPAQSTLFGEDR